MLHFFFFVDLKKIHPNVRISLFARFGIIVKKRTRKSSKKKILFKCTNRQRALWKDCVPTCYKIHTIYKEKWTWLSTKGVFIFISNGWHIRLRRQRLNTTFSHKSQRLCKYFFFTLRVMWFFRSSHASSQCCFIFRHTHNVYLQSRMLLLWQSEYCFNWVI